MPNADRETLENLRISTTYDKTLVVPEACVLRLEG